MPCGVQIFRVLPKTNSFRHIRKVMTYYSIEILQKIHLNICSITFQLLPGVQIVEQPVAFNFTLRNKIRELVYIFERLKFNIACVF